MTEDETLQFCTFKDCFARRLLHRIAEGSTNGSASSEDGDALNDFASYLAAESWFILPEIVKKATHEVKDKVPEVDAISFQSISPAFVDSLITYGIVPDADDAMKFLSKATDDYLVQVCAPLPPWSSTRTTECEICYREIPLTYHHLIPRSVQAKALKKGWHPEAMINSVAWLCRPCHSAVHHVASNEDLARYFHTVELLLEREDIQKWQKYAAKQRFGIKRD